MKTAIEMACEAGFEAKRGWGLLDSVPEDVFAGSVNITREIETFAALVRADERARMAEQPSPDIGNPITQQEPNRYQELREVLENLMIWQVKNVNKWHNGAYDQASMVLKRHDAEPQPPVQQEPVAWMHEWEDGERIPKLYPRDNRKTDKPIVVRPLVYADTGAKLEEKNA